MNYYYKKMFLARKHLFACLLAASAFMHALPLSAASVAVEANKEGRSAAVVSETPTSTASATSAATTTSSVDAGISSETGVTAMLGAGDTIYLMITPPSAEEGVITGGQPAPPLPSSRIFVLDKNGILDLPYLGRFALAGLTDEEAALRLRADPLLEKHQIELRRLPITKVGAEALESFGYSLFQAPSTFAPAEDIPVPPEYVISASDTVVIQFYGTINETHTLVVSRDGVINVPGIGPIQVAGLSFDELKRDLDRTVARQMIGVNAHISMGPLRTIRLFILGDVARPGSYTVSSLSTLTNALFAGGGVSPMGSLREIQLKRSGRVVTQFDLYDLLLKGDTSKDAMLRSGDVIFVPPKGRSVSVSGEVRRPAIYELRKEATIEQVLELAGGMLPSAYPKGAQLQRVSEKTYRVLEDLDLNKRMNKVMLVRDGDVLTIPALLDRMEEVVKLNGYVKRPGTRAWRAGMKLTDLIDSPRQLLPKPDLDYAVIRRHVLGAREIQVLSVRLGEAFATPAGESNIELMPEDEVIVFGHEVVGDRQIKLAPVIDELERQATRDQPAKTISVGGAVVEPGVYPLEAGMRVADALRAAGSLKEQADSTIAEISRYDAIPGKGMQVNHVSVNLTDALAGDKAANLELKSKDFLIVKSIPEWGEQQTVEITGEVRTPGIYPIARGEKLSRVIQRAGGLSNGAFPEGAVFTRLELQQKEEGLYKDLADRLEIGMKATLLERNDEAGRPLESSEIAKSLVDILRNAKSTGRMVVDLPTILAHTQAGYDVTLMDNDTIYIPQRKDEVSVVGEVRKSTTHLYAAGKSVDDYINMSGGLTEKANRKSVFIIRANGAATATMSGSWWASENKDAIVRPGDTIVSMLDVEKVSKLKIWRDVVAPLGGLGSLMTGMANVYTATQGLKIDRETDVAVPLE